jgi:DHA1 family bicyclomycin/chloramphenicol resistance-like MFS transporter
MRGVKRDAKQNSSLGIVFILGLLAMLMPLSIDMYLPGCR